MPIGDPLFYLLAASAILIVGISKGGFGGGLGIVAVPLMGLLISPVQAAAIMLPMVCLMDLYGLWAFRRTWDRRNISIMVPGAMLGIGLGMLAFGALDDAQVRLLIGCVALGFVLDRLLRRRAAAHLRAASRPIGTFWSMVSGFLSFIAHGGGPPVQIYLLPQRLDKTVFIGTTVVYYFFLNYAKIVPYGVLGLLSPETLLTALVLAPLTPLGMWLGVRLHRIIPEAPFYRACYAMLALTGAKLVWDGLQGE